MAEKMNAAVWLGPEKMEFQRVDRPVAGPGQALLKVAYGGICGSDIMIYLGKHPRAKAPLIACHEFSGTIVESDGNAFAPGTRVVVNPLLMCGHCYACKNGMPHVCATLGLLGIDADGGFGEYVAVPLDTVRPIPDSISLQEGALIEPLAVAVHAVRASRLKVGDVTAILGAGPVGMLVAQVARLAGARKVFVAEMSPKRLEIAEKLGFDVINVAEQDTAAVILDATDGAGVPVVFETAGVQATINNAAAVVSIGGQILQVGMPKTPPTINITDLLFREVQRQPIRVYRDKEDFQGAIDIAATGRVDLITPVSHIMPASQISEAMELMHAAKESCKILIDPTR